MEIDIILVIELIFIKHRVTYILILKIFYDIEHSTNESEWLSSEPRDPGWGLLAEYQLCLQI